jgi:hypothetical protein
MHDVTTWVRRRLGEKGFRSALRGTSGISVSRDSRPAVRVYCVGVDAGERVAERDLERAVDEMPDAEFVVVVPTRIADAAYELADELGVCVAGFGELVDALETDDDVTTHIDSQERYERQRLTRHPVVTGLRRRGHHAYTIERRRLDPLTIATTDKYEFTADGLYGLLEEHEGTNLDLVVVTNPNCWGLSTDSLTAARQTGTRVVLFSDFLDDLGSAW